MKDIYIKYNPFKVETEVSIDGKRVKQNSALNIVDRRLQEWIEELPQLLVDECNTKTFHVKFHGTQIDFEDLQWAAKEAHNFDIKMSVELIPANDINGKEQKIRDVFQDIQQGPFEELKTLDIINAFDVAFSTEFPVSVVATMSAGKSTLINALLQRKLMPSKHEACTATITEIKDDDRNDFTAFVLNSDDELIETIPILTYDTMKELNQNPDVSRVKIEGDIPFVSADDVALVLIDTPGPNSSRCPQHQTATYRMLSESSKTVVLYLLNATQLEINDDSAFLSYVSDSMKIGGKQSKDRFLFVVNKIDEFKEDDDNIRSSITKVSEYLEGKGIINPNIFPASSLSALYLRTILKDMNTEDLDLNEVDDEDLSDAIGKMRKLNRRQDLHLENYAPLPNRLKNELSAALEEAKIKNDKKKQALIHSGVVSIELAIRLYLAKYAKTAKIRNIVDTFDKRLENAGSFEKTRQEIAANTVRQHEICQQIEAIREKIKSGDEAAKFKEVIDNINIDQEIAKTTESVILEAQRKISEHIENSDKKMTVAEANEACDGYRKLIGSLFAKVQVKLEDEVEKHVIKTAQSLITEYKNKISDLTQGNDDDSIPIVPGSWIEFDIDKIDDIDSLISKIAKEEDVVTGKRFVPKGIRAWFNRNFGTSFTTRGDDVDITEKVKYVNGKELANKYFAVPQKRLHEMNSRAVKYAKLQTIEIKKAFSKKFDELNKIIEKKLEELQACSSDIDVIEKTINETTRRLKWLESIHEKLNAILDI